MEYYKWIEEGLSYEGRNYTYYIEDGSKIQYSIENNTITRVNIWINKNNRTYLHRLSGYDDDCLNLINTMYLSCGDIEIIRGMFTYRYKELLKDNDEKYCVMYYYNSERKDK